VLAVSPLPAGLYFACSFTRESAPAQKSGSVRLGVVPSLDKPRGAALQAEGSDGRAAPAPW
jgi:hypothetical protein